MFLLPLFSTFLELPQYNRGMNRKKSMLKKNKLLITQKTTYFGKKKTSAITHILFVWYIAFYCTTCAFWMHPEPVNNGIKVRQARVRLLLII